MIGAISVLTFVQIITFGVAGIVLLIGLLVCCVVARRKRRSVKYGVAPAYDPPANSEPKAVPLAIKSRVDKIPYDDTVLSMLAPGFAAKARK